MDLAWGSDWFLAGAADALGKSREGASLRRNGSKLVSACTARVPPPHPP